MMREEDVDAPENTLQLPPGPPQKRQKRERERGRSRWQRRVETAEEGCGGAWGGSLGAGRGGRRGAAGRTPGESRGSGHLTSRGVTPCLEARTSRPLSAPAAFYAVAWPLPGASMPQSRHLTLLPSWAGASSTKRHFGRFVVVFNGSLSGTRDKPAGI